MEWYVRKKAMQDPAAHLDDEPPIAQPQEHQLPLPQGSPPPPGIKLRPGRKKGKGPSLWRKNRE